MLNRMKSLELIKPYFIENRIVIACGLLFLVIVDALQLFIPRILKWAIDDLTLFEADAVRLAQYGGLIICAAVLIGFFRYLWRRCLIGTSRRIEEGLRNLLFSHIQTLSASYFGTVTTGDLMAHATNDIKNIRMATGMGLVALTDAVFLGTATIFFMAWINMRLTFFALLPMPMIVFSARFFSRIMHRRYKEVQARYAALTEGVRERLAGIRVIKAYTRENESTGAVEDLSTEYVDKNLGLVRITGSFFPLMLMFANLSLIVVIFLGGRLTIRGIITPGDFVAFVSYLGLLTWPMMALGWMTNLIQRGRASLDRIGAILARKPEIDDSPDASVIEDFKGEIIFDKVSFGYPDESKKALKDISITLSPGETLGIVGPPGSGKTTLLNLVPRLFDVTEGRVLIDGLDVRKIKVGFLRDQISFMPQEPFLFEGTIRENMVLGHEAAGLEELAAAARKASILEAIHAFRNGFETLVGEKGVILSGGQKQRIALARALLHDRPIQLLDDPISQVDMETGAAIIDTLSSFSGKKTVVITSHRLSAVRKAHRIIVLDEGRIVESGCHDELMAEGGYYARTFKLQEIGA